jgi:MFS family permease
MNKQTKIVIALGVIGAGLSMYSLTPALIAYIIGSYSSLSATTVSQLLTIPSIVGLAASFAAGPLALKISKKLLLMIAASAVLTYFLLFIIVGARGPFGLLIAAAMIVGIAQGAAVPIISSIINESLDPAKSASSLALILALMQGGGAVVSFIGGNIASINGGANWPNAYYIGLYLIPAMLIFAFLMPGKKASAPAAARAVPQAENKAEDNGKPSEPIAAAGKGIPVRVFLMILMLMLLNLCLLAFAFNISTYIISEYNLGTSAQAGMVNSIFMVVGMGVGFTYALWQKLLKNYLGIVGLVIVVAAIFVMMRITTTLAGVYIAAVLVGIGNNFSFPFIMAKIMESTPPKMVPVSMSLSMGGINIAVFVSVYTLNFAGGLLGGGLSNTLLAGGIFGIVAAVMSVFLLLPKKNVQSATTPTETSL